MNHFKNLTLFLAFLLTIGFGCNQKQTNTTDTPTKDDTEQVTDKTETPTETPASDAYLIEEKSFFGLTPNDLIADHSNILEKGVLQTGEGDFEVYNIKDTSGEILGNILPDPQDESKIGTITITTPKASTKEGIAIGSTFEELEKALGEVAVHGSEIESRTYAFKGHWAFLLDAYHNTYELDKSKIEGKTKIKTIDIRRNTYTK